MIYKLIVPGTLEDLKEVRVLEWHAEPDAMVSKGALVVELETHKAVIEVRAGQTGILRNRLCQEGDWCPLEGVLGVFSDTADEALPSGNEGLRDLEARFTIA